VGPNFHNLVVTWPSEEDPRQIQKELHKIEETYGRSRDKTREGAKFSSRTLDLDLILYGDRVMAEPGLILPRPDIIRYAFVLRPLADLAPLHRHPAIGRTFADLWQEFDVAKQPLWPLA
jgi:2-amino-4-hydroxy-6-hydroxymethyldihydropteridine diphosphokinase